MSEWVDINEQWVENDGDQWLGEVPAVVSGTTDLGAAITGVVYTDLPSYINGISYKDLPAFISTLRSKDLPAELSPVPPKDLPAYLKVWPQEDLPADIYGWDQKDLGAYVQTLQKNDLPAQIGGHLPEDLQGLIKGWVREAYRDLGATVSGKAQPVDLPAIIRATYLKDLGGYLFPVQPEDLPAQIYGWDSRDLQGIINALDYPYNLPASITGIFGRRDLPAYLGVKQDTRIPTDLPALLQGYGSKDLAATIGLKPAVDLAAEITPNGLGVNLPAEIYPKMIRLTAILSVVTMEHKDLNATISIPCFYSNLSDLSASLNVVFKSDLNAYINGQNPNPSYANLPATIGFSTEYVEYDRLPIGLDIASRGYRVEDKLITYLNVFKQAKSLSAQITGMPHSEDLTASILGLELTPYDFEAVKNRSRVYFLAKSMLEDYENIDIQFIDYVPDYFYTSAGDEVGKIDKYRGWTTLISSLYSPTTAARLGRKLHKVKRLYDMRKFESVDEAIRYAIDYVTEYPSADMSAFINPTGGNQNLTASLTPIYVTSDYTELTSSITGIGSYNYDVVVGFDEDGIGYLNF